MSLDVAGSPVDLLAQLRHRRGGALDDAQEDVAQPSHSVAALAQEIEPDDLI